MQNIGGLGALCPVTHWVIYPWYRRGAWARPRAENPTCTEESGMSNIQLNFTFNRLTTSPPVPLHTSSLRSCSKFAKTFLISISILAGQCCDTCFTSWPPPRIDSHLWEKKCAICEMTPGREGRVQEGNVMRTFLQNVMNVMTHDLATFIQNPAYTLYTLN